MTDQTEQTPEEDADIAKDPVVAKLRSLYDDVAGEPLPQRLLDLLDQLDEAERKE